MLKNLLRVKRFLKEKRSFFFSLLLFLFFFAITYVFGQPYSPGDAQLNPPCLPTDNTCTVIIDLVKTGTTATNTALLRAYDVDGATYTTFGTLTASNTPTFDLSTLTTMGGNSIYYVGGTDVAVADGGTGQSSYTNGQLLIGNTTGNTLTKGTLTGTSNQITVTNGAGTITLSTPQNINTTSSPTFTGLTLSSLTAGSILFTGTSGVTTQDNSKLFWDDTNNLLGIGTASPYGQLTVTEEADVATATRGIWVEEYGANDKASLFASRKARGTKASPSAILSGDAIANFAPYGYKATNWGGAGRFRFLATENWTDSATGSSFEIQTIENSTTTLAKAFTVNQDKSLFGESVFYLKEQSAALTDNAAYGQFWVKNDTPNTPYFTDDAGTDFKLTQGEAGTVILLSADETDVTGTLSTADIKTYSLAANSYNKIIIEAEVSLQGVADESDAVTFVLMIGSDSKEVIPLRQDATGAGDSWILGTSIKYSQAQTAAATISITAGVTAGAGVWAVRSLRVYGVI